MQSSPPLPPPIQTCSLQAGSNAHNGHRPASTLQRANSAPKAIAKNAKTSSIKSIFERSERPALDGRFLNLCQSFLNLVAFYNRNDTKDSRFRIFAVELNLMVRGVRSFGWDLCGGRRQLRSLPRPPLAPATCLGGMA